MKNKLMLSLMLGIFLISIVSASLDTLTPATLNKEYTVLQTCSDATWINLTISNTNGIILFNKEMTYNGTVWEYKFTPDTLGRHDVNYLTDGCEKSNTAYFEVKTNIFGTFVFYIIILILSLGIIVLGYYIEDAWVVLLGGLGFILLGLFIFIYGINGIKDSAYTYSFGIITIMLGAYFSVRASLEKMNLGLD
jgi:hypothetical protein